MNHPNRRKYILKLTAAEMIALALLAKQGANNTGFQSQTLAERAAAVVAKVHNVAVQAKKDNEYAGAEKQHKRARPIDTPKDRRGHSDTTVAGPEVVCSDPRGGVSDEPVNAS